jgi:hypothetical protein
MNLDFGPKLVLFQSIGNLKIEQRYRSEFRFTSNGYRNRFSYRLGVSYPFGKEINDYKPFQISASNEIFFTDKNLILNEIRMLRLHLIISLQKQQQYKLVIYISLITK